MSEIISYLPDHLELRSYGDIKFLVFKAAKDLPLVYGSFLRHGGVSSPPYSSLNVGRPKVDTIENTQNNRRLLLQALGKEHCSFLNQRHGTVLHETAKVQQTLVKLGDGLYTNVPGAALLIRHADCQGAVFYDPKTHSLANIHCGWRGLVANIYKVTVKKMQKRYGSSPSDLKIFISPSLGLCHAEYDEYKKIFPKEFQKFICENAHFDLLKISENQLINLGVLKSNIHCANICTYCHPEDFFSFRRDHVSANNATLVYLK